MRGAFITLLLVFEQLVLLYFFAINTSYLVCSVLAFFQLRQHRRRWTTRELEAVVQSPATPGVSVIAPAYNEQTTIVESMRSLLLLNYPQFEVICVNDGSKDETLTRASAAFDLVEAPMAVGAVIPTATVRAIYRSLTHAEFVLVDKENGGRADALNAGINAARYPLICLIDADSLLEPNALTQAVLPFLESPDTLGVGGIIRVVNGCKVEGGRVTEVRVPGNWVARFQVVEYLRAFLAGRVAHSAMGALLIISGAFGLYKRQEVLDAGGLEHKTIGEDMELCVRMHRIMRDRKQPYRLVFVPDPVCWTEVPESTRILGNQRNRWQRGLFQVLGYHRTDDRQPALRRRRPAGAAVLRGVRGARTGHRDLGLRRDDRRPLLRPDQLALCRADVPAVGGLRHADLAGRGGARGDFLPPLQAGQRSAAADRPGDRRELRLPPAHDLVADQGDLRFPEGQGRLGRDDRARASRRSRPPRRSDPPAPRDQPWRDFFGFEGRLSSTPAPRASRRSS